MPSPSLVARRPAALAARVGAAVVLVVAFGAGGAVVTDASAALPFHARLLSSMPGDGSRVEAATEVVLAFSEEVNPSFVIVTVTGPGGDEADGGARVEGRTVTQPLAPDLAAGEHVTTFRVVSADGHPVTGTVTFTTTGGPASGQPSATSPASTAPSEPAGSPTASPPGASTGPDEPASSQESSSTRWAVAGIGALLLTALAGGLWRSRRGTPRGPDVEEPGRP